MNWFRMFSDARTDLKLAKLSPAQHLVWFNLLCYASDQKPRGTIEADSLELLALEVARDDADLLQETLSLLVKLKMISWDADEGQKIEFLHWTERQYDKPSDTPKATAERKQKSRQEQQEQDAEEASHALSRAVTPHNRADQSRPEQIITEAEQSRAEVTPCHVEESAPEDAEQADPAPPRPLLSEKNGSAPPAFAETYVLSKFEMRDLLASGPPGGPNWTAEEISAGIALLKQRKKPPRHAKALLHASILPDVRAGKRAEPPEKPPPVVRAYVPPRPTEEPCQSKPPMESLRAAWRGKQSESAEKNGTDAVAKFMGEGE